MAARTLLPVVVAATLLATACSSGQSATQPTGNAPSTPPQASTAAPAALTVTNCEKEVAYEAVAQRIIATSNSTNLGTLLRIGAVDQLAAISLSTGNDAVMNTLYDVDVTDIPRLQSPISMEAILASDPDLLIGSYTGLFSGSSGITPESANDKGVPTYVISDSCRQDPDAGAGSAMGIMSPFDAVRDDIANYGVLTGNETGATEALAEFDARLAALEAAPKAEKAPRVLLFDSGTTELYTSGKNGSPQGILEAAGAENVFETEDTTWFKASWEAVAEREPDAIVVMDYRSDDPEEVANKVNTIRTQPALKNTEAVKQNRIIVLPLTLFMSGFSNVEAADQVRAGLEDMGLLPQTDIDGKLPDEFTAVP
jgi:iron complex transport system substrate-binding protein